MGRSRLLRDEILSGKIRILLLFIFRHANPVKSNPTR
jgi:hypothetical protein